MKNIENKKIIVVGIIMIITLIIIQSKVYAEGGQANGTNGTLYNKSVSYYFELARAMESSTGTLGKDSSINITGDYTDSSGNGIDCHLEKNTEYGAITFLAHSLYGNATSNDTTSTANNNTGVFQMSNGVYEYVANTYSSSENEEPTTNSYNGALTSADSRYVNKYVGNKHSIAGDGIIETDGWSGSYNFVNDNYPVLFRGMNGFFGYSNNTGRPSSTGARAVVVCGAGF